jgi:hypothetical protein
MGDYFSVANVRALELVGIDVWMKLSGATQAKILNEELRALNANQPLTAAIGASRAVNQESSVRLA